MTNYFSFCRISTVRRRALLEIASTRETLQGLKTAIKAMINLVQMFLILISSVDRIRIMAHKLLHLTSIFRLKKKSNVEKLYSLKKRKWKNKSMLKTCHMMDFCYHNLRIAHLVSILTILTQLHKRTRMMTSECTCITLRLIS